MFNPIALMTSLFGSSGTDATNAATQSPTGAGEAASPIGGAAGAGGVGTGGGGGFLDMMYKLQDPMGLTEDMNPALRFMMLAKPSAGVSGGGRTAGVSTGGVGNNLMAAAMMKKLGGMGGGATGLGIGANRPAQGSPQAAPDQGDTMANMLIRSRPPLTRPQTYTMAKPGLNLPPGGAFNPLALRRANRIFE
jgi:hypothetical protein